MDFAVDGGGVAGELREGLEVQALPQSRAFRLVRYFPEDHRRPRRPRNHCRPSWGAAGLAPSGRPRKPLPQAKRQQKRTKYYHDLVTDLMDPTSLRARNRRSRLMQLDVDALPTSYYWGAWRLAQAKKAVAKAKTQSWQ